MFNKTFLVACLLTIVVFHPFYSVQAEELKVADCIDNSVDCEDEEETTGSEEETENDEVGMSGSFLFDFFKMIIALLLVLALIYLLLKFMNKRNKLLNQVKTLDNLGGISVGPNKSVQIIRVGSKLYMVGIGDNVQLLDEITDEELINDLLKQSEDQQSANLMSNILPKKTKENVKTEQENNFRSMFTNELNRMKENRKKLVDKKAVKDERHE